MANTDAYGAAVVPFQGPGGYDDYPPPPGPTPPGHFQEGQVGLSDQPLPPALTMAGVPSAERAFQASQPQWWLAEAFKHRGPEAAECVAFACTGEAGEELLYAHKLPLAARSESFQFMLFGEGGGAAAPDVINVQCRPEAFDALIYFIYMDTLPEFGDYSLAEMHSLARTYRISSLSSQVAELIASNLNDENVVEILEEAVTMRSKHLQKLCAAYITENQMAVASSDAFVQLTRKSAATEAEKTAVRIISEAVFRGKLPESVAKQSPAKLMLEGGVVQTQTQLRLQNGSGGAAADELMTGLSAEETQLALMMQTAVSNEESLTADMARAFGNAVGADMELVSAKDSGVVRCSRWIMSMHSPYFAALVQRGQMREVVDASADAIHAMVMFLYCGELAGPSATLLELAPVSREYGLGNLLALLSHIPPLTVTPQNAVATLQEIKRRQIAPCSESDHVMQVCYTNIRNGWLEAALSVAEMEAEDHELFLQILRGAFKRPDDPAIDGRLSVVQWSTTAELVRRVTLDFVGSAGNIFEGSPLKCTTVPEMQLSLKCADLLDEIGAGMLGDTLARCVAKVVANHQLYDFVRLVMQSPKLGTGSSRDTVMIELMPLLGMLPSINKLLEQDNDRVLQLLLHIRDAPMFHGRDELERKLVQHAVKTSDVLNTELFEKLPFEVQMKVLAMRMETGAVGQASPHLPPPGMGR